MNKKISGLVLPLAALTLVLGTYAVVRADEPAKAAAPAAQGETTLQGEVLDLACYMGHGAMGADHAKCGKKCLMGSNAAGLMTADGSVVLLVEDHSKAKAFRSLVDLAGMQAKVTGTMAEKGGLKALLVTGVEKGK